MENCIDVFGYSKMIVIISRASSKLKKSTIKVNNVQIYGRSSGMCIEKWGKKSAKSHLYMADKYKI